MDVINEFETEFLKTDVQLFYTKLIFAKSVLFSPSLPSDKKQTKMFINIYNSITKQKKKEPQKT